MAITLTQLHSFLAVFRTGSVTAAADELIVTQPSVSAAVTALSREVGVGLTERVGRSIRPSPAGEAFAPYAADVIGLLEQGARAAREAAEAAGRELRIGAVTTAGEHIVPPLIEAFSASHPEIALSVDVGNRQRVFERVRSHRTDVAIGGRPPSEGVVGEPFLDNPIVIITAPGDPLAGKRSVPIEELGDRPWLLREEGSGTRMMTEEFLAAHELRPRILTLGSNGAIKQAARAGLGVSFQSRLAAELEIDLGLLATIEVGAPLPRRRWYLLRPAHGPVRPTVEAFLEFVRREGRDAVERAAAAARAREEMSPAAGRP
ncbi:MAG TPA: LysR family transcriptional regulator [Thermoleophilaceae bacterium]|nr:LysR family transcriptional regulator [Thermoleophilaceae bacterium]